MKSPKLRSAMPALAVGSLCALLAAGCAGGGSSSFNTGGANPPAQPAGVTDTSAPFLDPAAVAATGIPDLGANADMHGRQIFPVTDPWNTRVDTSPVDRASTTLITSIGLTSHLHPDFGQNPLYGIPYVVVSGRQAKVPMSFDIADQSDPGPYPIPANPPIEGGASSGGDRHILVIDRDNAKLYETWDSHPSGTGWHCGSGAVFNINTNTLRPAGWTSADAAGLPIFPGLVRYDEVAAGVIKHAIRFTVPHTRRAYIAPARHYASSNTSTALPPMGLRVRLKASFDISRYPAQAKVILQAMKTYGMIVADNGSSWYFQGAPSTHWDDNQLNTIKQVAGSNFEVVQMGR